MVRSILAILVLASILAVPASQAFAQEPPKEAPRVKFDPKRDPAKDLAEAVKVAKKQNRRILLDVGGEWCSWCHKLDKFFATNAEAGKILKEKYVVVKVNYSSENQNKKFLSKYPKISGYPHLFVLSSDGRLLHTQNTGDLETGPEHDAAKVIPFLKKWALP